MIDEVWMWVHPKYEMIQIVQKLYKTKTNNLSYLAVPDDDQLNQWNNETYNLSCTTIKIIITIKIWIDHMRIHCTIYSIWTEELCLPQLIRWFFQQKRVWIKSNNCSSNVVMQCESECENYIQ